MRADAGTRRRRDAPAADRQGQRVRGLLVLPAAGAGAVLLRRRRSRRHRARNRSRPTIRRVSTSTKAACCPAFARWRTWPATGSRAMPSPPSRRSGHPLPTVNKRIVAGPRTRGRDAQARGDGRARLGLALPQPLRRRPTAPAAASASSCRAGRSSAAATCSSSTTGRWSSSAPRRNRCWRCATAPNTAAGRPGCAPPTTSATAMSPSNCRPTGCSSSPTTCSPAMLRGLHLIVDEVVAPFEPEAGRLPGRRARARARA